MMDRKLRFQHNCNGAPHPLQEDMGMKTPQIDVRLRETKAATRRSHASLGDGAEAAEPTPKI